ncbi:transmembrane anchor protein [Dickeya dadantii]|uniref:transmembrane anchor protein n=1 Tax=Dickeya dadantii TaxID=204038 RepID=UPI001CF242B1|nr:transmembrane anchor protein [Dickeya dadantii]MCA7014376.1 transmembrane anchor protein [Dickeya dadantii]
MYNTDLPTRAELPSAIKLIQSTIFAAITALLLLITVVLPSEYGIDPTGIGRVLGLKKMGEIKASLAAEVVAGKANVSDSAATSRANASGSLVNERPVPDNTPVIVQSRYPELSAPVTRESEVVAASSLRHQMVITLKPNEAAEVKLEMRNGARVSYQWTSTGPVNIDAHGDPINPPKDFYHGYGKDRQVTSGDGVLQAAFDGKHGWFWRNRGSETVTIQLNTNGEYTGIKRVI